MNKIDLFLIKIEWFHQIQIWVNQLSCDDSIWFQEFGSNKSIKIWFDQDLSQNCSPGRFNRLSLIYYRQLDKFWLTSTSRFKKTRLSLKWLILVLDDSLSLMVPPFHCQLFEIWSCSVRPNFWPNWVVSWSIRPNVDRVTERSWTNGQFFWQPWFDPSIYSGWHGSLISWRGRKETNGAAYLEINLFHFSQGNQYTTGGKVTIPAWQSSTNCRIGCWFIEIFFIIRK